MEPLLVVYSQQPHDTDDLLCLRDAGFTHVCYAVASRHDWQKTAHMVKSVGLKLVAALPDWFGIDFDQETFQFETKNGQRSRTTETPAGPSYWCRHVEQEALDHPLMQEVVQALDAVVVAPRWGDDPYPVDWPSGHYFDFTYPRMFWSWDRWARLLWAYNHKQEMPEFARCDVDGVPEVDPEFYLWYQQAWQDRLWRISDWAMSFGLKDIWTWMVPYNDWTPENMVKGTAGSFPLLDKWAKHIDNSGRHPCFVLACLWSIWPGRKSSSIANARAFIDKYGWDVIVGTEASQSAETLTKNLTELGYHTRRIGAKGIFASDRYILQPQTQLHAIETTRMEAHRWRDHLAECG